jgi:hypothetical protein
LAQGAETRLLLCSYLSGLPLPVIEDPLGETAGDGQDEGEHDQDCDETGLPLEHFSFLPGLRLRTKAIVPAAVGGAITL